MMKKSPILGLALLLALLGTTASFASDRLTAHLERSGVSFEADGSYRVLSLRVTGEGQVVERDFGPNEQAFFAPAEFNLPDGSYNYEMVLGPDVEGLTRRVSREGGTEAREPVVASGNFLLENGSLVLPGDATEGPAADVAAPADGLVAAVEHDQVIADDLIVQFSACVGNDCVNGETFGFDTIRLKENNLRIKFDDTSVGSFPSNDWQIVANESANGGASYLAFQDDTNGRIPFRVDANAPTNSLRVESTGDVGIGTGSPVLELHVADGDTPGLRLEQNTSAGFGAQTWDIAGNETNFFVRDVTNGSKLPFKIFPNAPTNSLIVDGTTGNIGLGTASPSTSLHVLEGAGASAQLRVEDTGGDAILDIMELQNAGEVRFAMEDTSVANRRWEFRTTGPNFQFTRDSAPAADLLIDTAGNLTVRGNLVTGGGGTCSPGPCDGTFTHYELESIEEHSEYMWENQHLWGVGPTPEGEPINLSKKTTGILHELEKAHIYIEQLNDQLKHQAGQIADLTATLQTLDESDGK